ncbi:class II fumarate hydratase [Piscinibacter sakaiensis]|uniref:class II fumarate hydratase n=1 Tax=Piscinibacter sakaiensis TaxID=1547922 RepID=UPI003AAF7BD8
MNQIRRDSLGEVQIQAGALWGAQTQRAVAHFAIGGERMPIELIHALARIKGCCAVVNGRLGRLDPKLAAAIDAAAQQVCSGRHDEQFPLSIWQSGSGTQSHMNVNEVLATLASLELGDRTVHPNDDVNLGQSSNDMVPSAIHLATLTALHERLFPPLERLCETIADKARQHDGLIKLGRTHLQDAVPLTVGQEMAAWRSQLLLARASLDASLPALQALAVGGTAVGTGLNTHADFGTWVCRELSARTGFDLVCAADRFAALAGHEALVAVHSGLKLLAVALNKLANDVRLLGSGPRAGLGELLLPANEPGSSIMPGKVNPTQSEAMTMVVCQVLGNDAALAFGAASGHLQLNTFKPLIASNLLRSIRLLADAMDSFDRHCMRGIEADPRRIEALLQGSLMLVTALTPHIGYDRAAAIAHRAHAEHSSLRDAAIAEGIAADDFDRWVRPEMMVGSLSPAPT